MAPSAEIIGNWAPGLKDWLQVEDGVWTWSWHAENAAGGTSSGDGTLIVQDDRYRWQIALPANAAAALTRINLTPQDTTWLPLHAPDLEALADMPPLPHLGVDSASYPDLVSMLRDLLTPLFGAVVVHWPAYPVPVRSPPAQSGEVDLAACLREAVTIWNAGEPEPWFVWQPDAAWGVRLAHFSGSIRQPPLMIQLTRLDPEHRPLAMRIVAGDNYASAPSRPYAVRAMAHELGHALCLWGHSPDREHLLWGAAPPLRDDPSADERRAARLLRLLPPGLDLNRYGRETDP